VDKRKTHLLILNASAPILFTPLQVDATDGADVRTLGRLFMELHVADALQPLFRAGQPKHLRHVAEEVCTYLDTLKVRDLVARMDYNQINLSYLGFSCDGPPEAAGPAAPPAPHRLGWFRTWYGHAEGACSDTESRPSALAIAWPRVELHAQSTRYRWIRQRGHRPQGCAYQRHVR